MTRILKQDNIEDTPQDIGRAGRHLQQAVFPSYHCHHTDKVETPACTDSSKSGSLPQDRIVRTNMQHNNGRGFH